MPKHTARILVVLAFVFAATVGWGCQKQAGTGGTTSETPVKGGKFVYGTMEEPDTLNPYISQLLESVNVSNLFLDGLTRVDEKMKVIPVLAEEVPTTENGGVSEDGKTITYRLRKGVKWSDGKPFTSADVAFTQSVMMNPKVNVSNRSGYDKVTKVDTPDESTVIFHLKEPFAPFVNSCFQYGILPKHALEKSKDLNKDPWNRTLNPGLGPFTLKTWKQGQFIEGERNKTYYGGQAYLDNVIVKFVTDPNALFAQLKSGEIDWFEFAPATLSKNIKALPNVTLHESDTLSFENYSLVMKPGSPLKDVKVRQAISHAINVAQIVKTLYPGETQAATTQHPLSWAFNADLKPYTYDPAEAKKLLDEAGWKDANNDGIREKGGKRLFLIISTTAGQSDREQKEEVIVQDLKKVGIGAEVKNYDPPTFFGAFTDGGTLTSGKCDIGIFTNVAGVDPDNWTLFNSANIPSSTNPGGQNTGRINDPQINKLTSEGQVELDQTKRAEIYKEIDKIILEKAYTVLERWWKNYDGVNKRVHNAKPNPTSQGNLWNPMELWVSGK
ncbi:MAG: peptide ABC transporter substrate-binding protein [Actinobacteria bacterium]|nr:MAG: peptide ABC transporter substrate-binding protein [Actinomycetota bacterium]